MSRTKKVPTNRQLRQEHSRNMDKQERIKVTVMAHVQTLSRRVCNNKHNKTELDIIVWRNQGNEVVVATLNFM